MLRSEFYEMTGLTEKAIDKAMYDEIEKLYMKEFKYKADAANWILDNTTKQTFCKTFYELYRKTVSTAVSETIINASMEEKLALADGAENALGARADAVRIEKTWQLIKLLSF